MENKDHAYVKLQRHLDRQAVGFPATRSGAEIRLLKHIFNPLEAEIATCLTYRFEPLDRIFERVGRRVETLEKLEEILDGIEKKGGIGSIVKGGKRHFCNIPLVVGMLEFQVGKLTPEFIRDFDEYTSDKRFGIEFFEHKTPADAHHSHRRIHPAAEPCRHIR